MSFLFGSDDPAPAPAPEPVVAPKPEDAALRAQEEKQRAMGAGISKGDNEVDALGNVVAKKKAAGRAILG